MGKIKKKYKMKYYTVAIVLLLAATAQCGFFSFLLKGAAKLSPVLKVVSTAIDIVDALKSDGQLEKILAATAAPGQTIPAPAPPAGDHTAPGGDCWANGKENEPLCQGHGYDTVKCDSFKNKDGSPKCHWGPEMHHEEKGGDCWANGKENEPLCQGHHYDERKCATFKNKDGSPKCHWGPEMEENWEEEAKKLFATVEAALKKNGFTLESFQQQLGGLAKKLTAAKKDLAEDSEIGFSTL